MLPLLSIMTLWAVRSLAGTGKPVVRTVAGKKSGCNDGSAQFQIVTPFLEYEMSVFGRVIRSFRKLS